MFILFCIAFLLSVYFIIRSLCLLTVCIQYPLPKFSPWVATNLISFSMSLFTFEFQLTYNTMRLSWWLQR